MNIFNKTICRLILFLGIHHLVKWLMSSGKVTIVLYHDPSPTIFQKHIEYLKKKYSLISLQHFIASLADRSVALPAHALVITFDDGHKGNYQLLETIISNGLTPTFYICSGIVGTNRKFWFKLPGLNVQQLKGLDHEERLSALRQIDFTTISEFPESERQGINDIELERMRLHVDFQSHTKFHPILTTCSYETVMDELKNSRQELEGKVKRKVAHFAYPNGDYSEREIGVLKEIGYESARTTDIGWNDRTTDPYRLKITGVNDRAPVWMLKAELTGIPGYLYNLYKSGISWRSLQGKHIAERK